jgi:vacuolar-type H+-ATPase subunit I/STV1
LDFSYQEIVKQSYDILEMAQVNSPWPGYVHEENSVSSNTMYVSPNGTPVRNLSSSEGGRFAFSSNSPNARNSPLLSVNEKRRRLVKKMNEIDSRMHELEKEGKTDEEISDDEVLFGLMKEYIQLKVRLGVKNNNNNNNSNAENSSSNYQRRKSRKNRKDKKGRRKNTRRH